MDASEYDALMGAVQEIAAQSGRSSPPAGLPPFPVISEQRRKEMTDSELIHAVLGVRT